MSLLNGESTKQLSVYRSLWVSFWMLGTINNFGYVVVIAAAKSLADSFGEANLVGLIAWANVGFGILVKIANTTSTAEAYSHSFRLVIATAIMVIGLAVISVSVMVDFALCIVGIVILGSFSSLGESVALGWLKLFPPSLTGAWSSGTGMAGVGGTLFYLGLKTIFNGMQISESLTNEYCFLLLIPFAIVYAYLVYIIGYYVRSDGKRMEEPIMGIVPAELDDESLQRIEEHAQIKKEISIPKIVTSADSPSAMSPFVFSKRENSSGSEQSTTMLRTSYGTIDDIRVLKPQISFFYSGRGTKISGEGVFVPESASVLKSNTRIGLMEPLSQKDDMHLRSVYWIAFQLVFSKSMQLAAVYFFEYVISIGFAAASKAIDPPNDWFKENSYEILAFCYQLGVLLSRSSIGFIKLKRIEVLTLLQCINFVVWFFHIMQPFMTQWLQIVWMFYVGLLGGSMYVQTFYSIMSDASIPDDFREKCLNITSLMVLFGIVASSVFDILLTKVIL